MTDKYNVVIEVVDTKEYISIELPQDEDSLQEQLKEYGINENTKVRLPFLNGKIENDEDMLIETDLWYVTDKTFSGMEGLNVLLSKSEELKNERVESYAMEHRDDINSPENLLNLLVQKEDIPYHEYTSDPDAGITRGTSANGKFGRTYLYENYKEMWRDINTILCRTEKMIDYPIEIGVDPFGNLTRINNALEAMPAELEEAQTKLSNVEHQLETAKIEVNKPFLQEAELSEKLERLAELDALLNMGEKEDSIIENTTEDIIEPVITPANKFTKRVKPRGPKL